MHVSKKYSCFALMGYVLAFLGLFAFGLIIKSSLVPVEAAGVDVVYANDLSAFFVNYVIVTFLLSPAYVLIKPLKDIELLSKKVFRLNVALFVILLVFGFVGSINAIKYYEVNLAQRHTKIETLYKARSKVFTEISGISTEAKESYPDTKALLKDIAATEVKVNDYKITLDRNPELKEKENYIRLKDLFNALSTQMTEVEGPYNHLVTNYNLRIGKFPFSLPPVYSYLPPFATL